MEQNAGPATVQSTFPKHHVADTRTVTAQHVRAILRSRSNRLQFFPAHLFADPAWEMLLELYATALAGERISVSGLCASSGVPDTTALRWVSNLERANLLMREPDVLDRRRLWVRLTPGATNAMECYFASTSVTPL